MGTLVGLWKSVVALMIPLIWFASDFQILSLGSSGYLKIKQKKKSGAFEHAPTRNKKRQKCKLEFTMNRS